MLAKLLANAGALMSAKSFIDSLTPEQIDKLRGIAAGAITTKMIKADDKPATSAAIAKFSEGESFEAVASLWINNGGPQEYQNTAFTPSAFLCPNCLQLTALEPLE